VKDQKSIGLYVKSKCSICLNGRRKGIFVNCPYCDEERDQVIEASFKTTKEILKENLTEEQKSELIKFLTQQDEIE
jgi:hypothetical protein